ncbi:MAG: Gfo/Idh/MocA family oxidoreductase [Deltaproteobacteria bacterium]|nr:Gfo/Idh/MocA family oxidoreductase [Deltaproteobacteria bacterium]
MKNFALTGAGGYIAPRHLRAIRDTHNNLVAAMDPKDSVGVLDQYSFDVRFFTEFERFDRHLEKLRRAGESKRIHWLSICSPNYLHDAHCRLGLHVGADVICEKPLVINPWNLEPLRELEQETGRKIYTVLQLRVHPKLIALRERLLSEKSDRVHEVELTYITSRGAWYDVSWKGDVSKSGGVPTNIGVHFFDLLMWLFGEVEDTKIHLAAPRRTSGFIAFERAHVKWFLSVEQKDLPFVAEPGKKTTYRSITIDGEEIEFSEGFTDLHTVVYQEILAGRGYGIDAAQPAVELTYRLRTTETTAIDDTAHPLMRR